MGPCEIGYARRRYLGLHVVGEAWAPNARNGLGPDDALAPVYPSRGVLRDPGVPEDTIRGFPITGAPPLQALEVAGAEEAAAPVILDLSWRRR